MSGWSQIENKFQIEVNTMGHHDSDQEDERAQHQDHHHHHHQHHHSTQQPPVSLTHALLDLFYSFAAFTREKNKMSSIQTF